MSFAHPLATEILHGGELLGRHAHDGPDAESDLTGASSSCPAPVVFLGRDLGDPSIHADDPVWRQWGMDGGEVELDGGDLALQPMRFVSPALARRIRDAHIASTWGGRGMRPALLRSCLATSRARQTRRPPVEHDSPLAAALTDYQRMLLKRGLFPTPPPPGFVSPDYWYVTRLLLQM